MQCFAADACHSSYVVRRMGIAMHWHDFAQQITSRYESCTFVKNAENIIKKPASGKLPDAAGQHAAIALGLDHLNLHGLPVQRHIVELTLCLQGICFLLIHNVGLPSRAAAAWQHLCSGPHTYSFVSPRTWRD